MSAVATSPHDTQTTTAVDAPARAGGFDWPLLGFASTLAALGLLMILSASSLDADMTYGNAFHFVTRQVVGLGLGALASAVILSVPWSWLRRSVWLAYGASFVSLLLVMSPLGHSAKGAARWIKLGPLNLQPSEFAKVALMLKLRNTLPGSSQRRFSRTPQKMRSATDSKPASFTSNPGE